MNTEPPHEIVPDKELTPEARERYLQLTDEQVRQLSVMTPEQRGRWLWKRKRQAKGDRNRAIDSLLGLNPIEGPFQKRKGREFPRPDPNLKAPAAIHRPQHRG